MSIFVQIASYRDPQLLPTIRDLLAKADDPSAFTFGICWQHDDTEPIDTFDGRANFRVIKVPYAESKGLGWARAATNSLYAGEDYTLQLDSHHRFAKGWDTMLLEDYNQALTLAPKPIISCYATPFDAENDAQLNPCPCIMRQYEFCPERLIMSMPHYIGGDGFGGKAHSELDCVLPSRFLSAHFLFAEGEFVRRVPYDPEIYFGGYTEETTMSLRAYTHGYDVFSPYRAYVWHEYTRNNRVKHWEDHSLWARRDAVSKNKTRQLFGQEDSGSLAQFEQFAALDLKNCKALERPGDPRKMIEAWWPSAVLAYTLVWILVHSGVRHMVTCTRVYRSTTDHRMFYKLLDTINGSRAWTFGVHVVDGKCLPMCAVCLSPAFVVWTSVQYVGLDTRIAADMTVVTALGSPTLVPDPTDAADDADDENSITVLESTSNDSNDSCLSMFTETAVSEFVPPDVRARVDVVAARIAEHYMRDKCASKVFVLLGEPGCGKSTTARRVACLLNAKLYPRYNATRTGHCLFNVMQEWADPTPLIVAFEEFDVALAKVVSNTVVEKATRLDAADKATWNSLLDSLKRKKHVVLIMTSNRTKEALLKDVCKGDASLLRPGRVDEIIEFAHGDQACPPAKAVEKPTWDGEHKRMRWRSGR